MGRLLTQTQEKVLGAAALAGWVVILLGWFVDRQGAAAGLLVGVQYGLGLAVGGLAFIVLGHVTRAGWGAALRRVPEALSMSLPVVSLVAFLGLLLALPLYAWSHADVVAGDALLQHKAPWLNTTGFVLRAALFLGLWTLFAWLLRRASTAQDRVPGAAGTYRQLALSAAFLAVFAVTWSLASFDWLMSLEAHWFSTVYGIYCFSGALLSALAAIVLLVIGLERAGPLRGVLRDDHLHDLGKLVFGFATFWAYIWFCQYMLIWYSNIPEETSYYVVRTAGAWRGLMIALLVLMWGVPFLALISRNAKRSRRRMVQVAVVVLVARWLDLHLLVLPGVRADAPGAFGWEVPALVAVLPIVLLATLRAFQRAAPVPRGDPYLVESLHYHA
jgi:hypothetical protein